MYSLLLMALGGLLIGGAYTYFVQKTPRWIPIMLLALAVMSLVAAFLLTLPSNK